MWPATTVTCLYMFRSDIRGFAQRISEAKFAGIELKADKEAQEAYVSALKVAATEIEDAEFEEIEKSEDKTEAEIKRIGPVNALRLKESEIRADVEELAVKFCSIQQSDLSSYSTPKLLFSLRTKQPRMQAELDSIAKIIAAIEEANSERNIDTSTTKSLIDASNFARAALKSKARKIEESEA